MEQQIINEYEHIEIVKEVSEIRIVCDKCEDYHVKFRRGNTDDMRSDSPTFTKIIITLPHPTLKWKTVEESKHYCEKCWAKLRELL